MNGNVVRTLIMKDWRLHRRQIMISVAAGAIALGVIQLRSETAFLVGAVWFFVSLIVLASMVPVSNVINERKKQTVVFLMSLPVSALQYATSKMVSTVGMFLVPWAAMVIAGSALVLSRHDIPNGIIPLMLILFGLPLIGFCMIASAALISESEGWVIAATVACNSSYGLVWYFIIRNPAINGDLKSPVPVWSAPVVTILAAEAAAVVLILGLTFYLQSRKRDFV
jgi:ABC-2 type transport system permease protein